MALVEFGHLREIPAPRRAVYQRRRIWIEDRLTPSIVRIYAQEACGINVPMILKTSLPRLPLGFISSSYVDPHSRFCLNSPGLNIPTSLLQLPIHVKCTGKYIDISQCLSKSIDERLLPLLQYTDELLCEK